MKKNEYSLIGVMSGTSLDGIDLVLVNFNFSETVTSSLEVFETIAYSTYWKNKLEEAVHYDSAQLFNLDNEYTAYLGKILNTFIKDYKIINLDGICSHGHTVKHQPDQGFTIQIGNLPQLAQTTNNMVVCDFRSQDVTYGGQGAPLVPIGDAILFSNYTYCLNIGGFSNISFNRNGVRIAGDICAVNTVFNHYIKKMGFEFDKGGEVARSGKLNKGPLKKLSDLNFYKQQFPKSLGIEWVEREVFPLIDQEEENIPDILHTYSIHAAQQIADCLDHNPKSTVLVTGGGAFNTFFIERLKSASPCTLHIPPASLINYKEALIFAFLGALKLRGETNVLSSVTGAKIDHSSGKIYMPN